MSKQEQQAQDRLAKLFGAKTRITEADEYLIQSVFNDQIEPYMALRNLFFGFGLTDAELAILAPLKTPQFKKILWKIFLPELEKDAPVGHNKDLWMTKDFDPTNMVDESNFELRFNTKTLFLEMMHQALFRIEDESKRPDLTVRKDLAHLLARNSFINYIETQISQCLMVLGTKRQLTPEEALMRLKQDSSK